MSIFFSEGKNGVIERIKYYRHTQKQPHKVKDILTWKGLKVHTKHTLTL